MRSHTTNVRLFTATLAAMTLAPAASAQFDALRRLGQGTPAESKKKVACFKLKGELVETPMTIPPIFGGDQPQSLKGVLSRLKDARSDPNVVAVVIDVQEAQLGFGQLEELNAELRKFRVIDKPVYVHADYLTNLTYALAVGGSHVSLVPTGNVWLMGLYGETPYLRGTLDKIGAIPDFERCADCDYKSATEILMRTGPSQEADAMRAWLLDSIYERFIELIAESRGKTSEAVRALIDDGPYSAEAALKAGLIDAVRHRQDFVADLESRYGESVEFATKYGKDDEEDLPQDFFAMFQRLMKILNPASEKYTKPSVAVVYVDGSIMPGEGERSPFGPPEGAFSTTIRKALDEAADEDTVKAVVLRVDSPGGSALASEIILDAGMRVQEKKPFVVSMGNVAGSGGYYVSCMADAIFADAGTITASIGVLGGKIVTTGMWDKLGVNWHAKQRGKMAALFSSAAQFSDAERAKIRGYMEEVYDVFTTHVERGRGDKLTKPLAEIAGGRVYTGAQALELGLVDKIGGLEDAIKFAADKAGVGEFEIRVIPEPPSLLDMFMGGRDDDEFARLSGRKSLVLERLPTYQELLPILHRIDPQRARAILRALQRIDLIHAERVITMMAEEYVIR